MRKTIAWMFLLLVPLFGGVAGCGLLSINDEIEELRDAKRELQQSYEDDRQEKSALEDRLELARREYEAGELEPEEFKRFRADMEGQLAGVNASLAARNEGLVEAFSGLEEKLEALLETTTEVKDGVSGGISDISQGKVATGVVALLGAVGLGGRKLVKKADELQKSIAASHTTIDRKATEARRAAMASYHESKAAHGAVTGVNQNPAMGPGLTASPVPRGSAMPSLDFDDDMESEFSFQS